MHRTPKNLARRITRAPATTPLTAALFASVERAPRGSRLYRARTTERDGSTLPRRPGRAAARPCIALMADWPEPDAARAAPAANIAGLAALWWCKPFLLATHWGLRNIRR